MMVSDEGVCSQYESSFHVGEGVFFVLMRPPVTSRGVLLNSRNDRYLYKGVLVGRGC